jgi:hypothetical protein
VTAGGERNFWSERGAQLHATGAAVPSGDIIAKAAADYVADLRQVSRKAERITDKMPFNFLWTGLIYRALPHATIVHCRRAAVDTALSIHQTHFHPILAFPTGGAELVRYFASYRKLTDHWRNIVPPARFIEVEYETLTSEPENEIRKLIAACELPWHDACLQPHTRAGAVKTPSKWQIRQPIYRSSVAKWQRYEPWLGALRGLLEPAPGTTG